MNELFDVAYLVQNFIKKNNWKFCFIGEPEIITKMEGLFRDIPEI